MPPEPCCPHLHRAVELVGRRWTGAILAVLIETREPLRFGDIKSAVPSLSDRLLAERVRELEQHGLLTHADGRYDLTEMGRALEPALAELGDWARRWLAAREERTTRIAPPGPR